MTLATLAPRRVRPPAGPKARQRRPWFGIVFGLLLGLAAVCHGCHVGDRDDELSFNAGKPNVQRGSGENATAPKQPGERGASAP